MIYLGKIQFTRDDEGTINILQGWNPSMLTKTERLVIVEDLTNIASAILKDEFEVAPHKLQKFEPAPESSSQEKSS